MDVSPHPPVPRTAEDATPEWFTGVLHGTGLLKPPARVSTVRHASVGNGLVCQSIRFELTYSPEHAGAAAPASVVCKLPPPDRTYRAAAVAELVYSRELGFYKDLAGSVALRVPRCLYQDRDEDNDDFVLMLEDLSPAVGGDQIAGCSLDQAETVVTAAAGLHAPFWGSTELDDASWNVRSLWLPRIAASYPGLFDQFAIYYADDVSSADLAIGEAFAPVIGRWFTEQPRPWTVTHGDFRLDNMLFDIRGGAEPLGVLDWQTLLPAPGAADVSYFLGGCLSTELRRAHEHDLLRRYHAALMSHGVTDYSFGRCLRDYRHAAFLGYFMASYAACLVRHTERGDQMFATWLRRAAAQIHDLDCLSLLPA